MNASSATPARRSTLASVTRLISMLVLTLGSTAWALLLAMSLQGMGRRMAEQVLWLAGATFVVLLLPTMILGGVLRSRGESARYAGIAVGLVGGLVAITVVRALVG